MEPMWRTMRGRSAGWCLPPEIAAASTVNGEIVATVDRPRTGLGKERRPVRFADATRRCGHGWQRSSSSARCESDGLTHTFLTVRGFLRYFGTAGRPATRRHAVEALARLHVHGPPVDWAGILPTTPARDGGSADLCVPASAFLAMARADRHPAGLVAAPTIRSLCRGVVGRWCRVLLTGVVVSRSIRGGRPPGSAAVVLLPGAGFWSWPCGADEVGFGRWRS